MNILLKFSDNTSLITRVTKRNKIDYLFKSIQEEKKYTNNNAIVYKYRKYNKNTNKNEMITLDKSKTFKYYKILVNTCIHVEVNISMAFQIYERLITEENASINIKKVDSNKEIIEKIKEMGHNDLDDEVLEQIIDNYKLQNNTDKINANDIINLIFN
jgi:hypothetical protein